MEVEGGNARASTPPLSVRRGHTHPGPHYPSWHGRCCPPSHCRRWPRDGGGSSGGLRGTAAQRGREAWELSERGAGRLGPRRPCRTSGSRPSTQKRCPRRPGTSSRRDAARRRRSAGAQGGRPGPRGSGRRRRRRQASESGSARRPTGSRTRDRRSGGISTVRRRVCLSAASHQSLAITPHVARLHVGREGGGGSHRWGRCMAGLRAAAAQGEGSRGEASK